MGLEVRILGSLDISTGNRGVRLGGPKQRAVLAALLLERGRRVGTDVLIENFWAGRPPESAARSVQVYVSTLRRLLGDTVRIESVAGGYRLTLPGAELDVDRFERLLEEGRRLRPNDPERAAAVLRDALALWRGPALLDVRDELFARPEADRLDELRLVALEERIEADLALGGHDRLVAELERLTSEHPFRERLRAQLMLALYRSARHAEALAVYADARRTLNDELGLEPSTDLRDLQVAILRQDPSLGVEPAELRARRHLPAPPTPLVGRRREVDDVVALLRGDARLVTLTGAAGTGKTRVAVQAAHELADRFTDGLYFVDLAPLRDPDLVPTTIARALGLRERSGRALREDLTQHLRTRKTLLVLDNFERVDAAAPLAAALLRAAEGLKLLVTSRSALRLYGEHEYPLAPLSLDDEAIPLFTARATAAAPAFRARRDAVAEICERLDCLPLAIELTAARARELSAAQMLGTLHDRLALATGGPRDVPARQQTLRGAIAWSYDALTAEDREAFGRLAVFLGGFSEHAAQEVCGVDVETLRSLARASLLREREGRFGFLEAIHEFAVEQLDASRAADEVRRRHAEEFLRVAQEAAHELRGPRQVACLERMETEHDNFRGALAWALDADPALAARIAGSLYWFWQLRSHLEEGRRWLGAALEATPHAEPSVRAPVLEGAGQLAYYSGDLESAERALGAAVESWREVDDPASLAVSLAYLAIAAGHAGNQHVASAAGEEAMRIAEGLDGWTLGLALWSHGTNLLLGRAGPANMAEARSLLGRSIAVLRPTGDDWAIGAPLYYLGTIAAQTGDDSGAATHIEEAADAFRAVGDRWRLRIALAKLAELAERAGDDAEASARAREAEALARELPLDPLRDSG